LKFGESGGEPPHSLQVLPRDNFSAKQRLHYWGRASHW
jgi:hypothetical protein